MMGCGASRDVIKSASSENEPTKKGEDGGAPTANGDTKQNGNIIAKNARSTKKNSTSSSQSQSQDSLNSSLVSEGSTIPASEKFGNNNGNNNVGLLNNSGSGGSDGSNNSNSNNSRNLPELPPLKPPRTSRVGFLDQNLSETMTEAEADANKSVPIAFEVPAEEDASLIKKHPPRRLRQLEERPPETTSITQEALVEKVAQANERRNQVLHQRVASARQKSARTGRIRRPMMESELEASETMESQEGAAVPGE